MASEPEPHSEFAAVSDTESICLLCSAMVRSQTGDTLHLVEELHRRSCPVYSRPPFV